MMNEANSNNHLIPAAPLPFSKNINWLALLAIVWTLGELVWGASTVVQGSTLFGDTLWRVITVLPALILNTICWYQISKAIKVYYLKPESYTSESKLKIDQARLMTIISSFFCGILIIRTAVIIFGRVSYS